MDITSGLISPEREHKGKSLLAALTDYVALDLETTGLSPEYDDIIEVAAVRVTGGQPTAEYQSLIRLTYPLDPFITELTGITDEMLAGAPERDTVLAEFAEFVGGSVVVAHNANFDVNFLYDALASRGIVFANDFVDTMRLSRRLWPEERHHRLEDVVKRLGVGAAVGHRALADAHQARECYETMLRHMAANGIDPQTLYPHKIHHHGVKVSELNRAEDAPLDSPIAGQIFVFTGALDRMTRREAMQLVLDLGGECADSVVKKTNYLILGNNDYIANIRDGKSNKQRRAEELILKGADLQIMPESVFYDFIDQIRAELVS